MKLFLLLIVVVMIGLTAAVALGRLGAVGAGGALGGGLADPASTQGFVPLPDGPLDPAQIAGLGFDRAFRGYRMDQVDDVIDRLRSELRERDEALAGLRPRDQASARGELGDPAEPGDLGDLGALGDLGELSDLGEPRDVRGAG